MKRRGDEDGECGETSNVLAASRLCKQLSRILARLDARPHMTSSPSRALHVLTFTSRQHPFSSFQPSSAPWTLACEIAELLINILTHRLSRCGRSRVAVEFVSRPSAQEISSHQLVGPGSPEVCSQCVLCPHTTLMFSFEHYWRREQTPACTWTDISECSAGHIKRTLTYAPTMSGHFGVGPTSTDNEKPFVYTSIRYDRRLYHTAKNTAASCGKPCPFYMLEHHWTRLQVAKWSTFFFSDDRPRPNSGGPTIILQVLLNAVKDWHEKHPDENPEALRIKLCAYVGDKMRTEIYHPLKSIPMTGLFPTTFDLPVEQRRETEWSILLDTEPTEACEGTMFKTSDRSTYARARAAADIVNYMMPREVLLWDHDRNVIDGSICTVYLYRQGRWVTPSAAAGGLQGTTRRWALENQLAFEGEIPIDSMVDGEVVWLSNAVRGYFWAIYQSRDPPQDQPDEAVVQRIHHERFI